MGLRRAPHVPPKRQAGTLNDEIDLLGTGGRDKCCDPVNSSAAQEILTSERESLAQAMREVVELEQLYLSSSSQ